MQAKSFKPVVDRESEVLILGSMPGRVSLGANQYYAHPRNLFWRIMEQVLGVDASAPYQERIAQLRARHVGLWDVLKVCTRDGSLDSAIDPRSVEPNEFSALLEDYPRLHKVCFNGAKAAALFRRHVLPNLARASELDLHDLPSSSPANTRSTFEGKLEAWRIVAPAA